MTRNEVLTLQRQLNAEGYDLVIDGVYGPNTARAYQEWLDANTPEVVTTPAPKPAAPWWRHKVVIGLLATALAGITSRWGVDADELTAILLQLAEVAGLVLAAWGTVPAQSVPVDTTLVARVHGQSVRLPSTHSLPADSKADKPVGPFGH